MLLGAGAVAATVAAVAVLAPGEPPPRAGAEPTGSTAPRPAEWRTEYWHDVAVDVPADWWYGGGPMADGDQALACYPEPIVSPEGERREGRGSSAPGWVGRPLHLTDVCAVVGEQQPEQPYLWFDAPVDTGTVDLAGGWTQQTVAVNGSRITVATEDEALRRQILASATGGETCFSELEHLDDPAAAPPPPVEGETVCAYRESGGLARLTYATSLTPGRAERFAAAVESAPPARELGTRSCDLAGAGFEWAVVHAAGEVYVVRTGAGGCPHVQHGDRVVRLTPEVVEPWAVRGIAAVMVGPTGGKGAMIDSFIGPMG